MRVILLTNTLMRDNGGAAQALDLGTAAKARGIKTEVAVVVPPLFGLRHAAADLVHPFALDEIFIAPLGITEGKNLQERLPRWRRIRRVLLRSVRLLRQARGHATGSRRFREADVVIAASYLSFGGLSRLRALSPARVVFSHTGSVDSFSRLWLTPSHLPPGFSGTRIEAYRSFVRRFDALLFEAQDQRDECADVVPDMKDRMFVVRPAVLEKALRVASTEASPYAAGRRAIVNVGSLQPRKAQHVSIDAFRAIADEFPDADLHFVGSPFRAEYVDSLKAMVDSARLQGRVHFHGHRPDFARYIAHASVLLHSSNSEGVSRVIREAMFLRKTIVATDISGTRDALENEDSALLATAADPDALGGALRRVLADQALADRLAANACGRYAKHFSSQVYADAVAAMLDAVAALSPVKGGAEAFLKSRLTRSIWLCQQVSST